MIDKIIKKRNTIKDTFDGREFKIVTVGIGIVCENGVVIGADRKVTMSRGTRIKSLENKIFTLTFRDGKKLLVCGAGTTDHLKRAMSEINPYNFDTLDCGTYRDLVESNISRLRLRLSDRGLTYDATLIFGMIDVGNKPVIGHILPSGFVEIKYEGYFTTGIAAPYAEIVLKDSYSKDISLEDAKLIAGGLIEKIGKVDNDVEGMDVFCISVIDEQINELTWSERHAVSEENSFSFDFKRSLEDVRKVIKHWDDLLEEAEKKAQLKVQPKAQIEE
jgi:20S proteasome alpha/beta subunit